MSLRRWIAWLGIGVAGVVVLAGLLAAVVLVVLPLPATREWVRGELEELLSAALDDRVRIAAVPSLGPGWIRLEGVEIGADDPRPTARVEAVSLELGVASVVPPRLAVTADLLRPEIDLVRDRDGRWNVEPWAGSGEASPPDEDLGVPRWIARVALDARDGRVEVTGVAPQPLRLSSLALDCGLWVGVLRDSVFEIKTMSATLGDESRVSLHGTYEVEGAGRTYAVLGLDPLVGEDLGGLVASLRDDARLAGTATVEGTLDRPTVAVALTSGPAVLDGRAELRLEGAGLVVEASLDATELEMSRLLVDAPEARVTGRLQGSATLSEDEVRDLQAQIDVRDSRALGVDVGSLVAHAETRDGDVHVQADAATPAGGIRLTLQGEVEVAPPHRVRAAGNVVLKDASSLPEPVRDYLAASDLRLDVSGLVADPLARAPTGALDVKLAPGRLRGLPVDGAAIELRLEPDLLSLDRLWIGADRTDLQGHAWMQLGGEARQRAVGGQIQGPLSLGLLLDAAGVVETDARFWGTTSDFGATGVVTSVGRVEMPGLEGSFSGRVDASHLGGDAEQADLGLEGAFSPRESLSRLLGPDERKTSIHASLSRAATPDRAVDRVEIDLRYGAGQPGSASLRAALESSATETRVEVGDLVVRPVVGPPWQLAAPAVVTVHADDVALEETQVQVGRGRIRAQGHVTGGATGANDLTVRVADLDLSILCDLLVVGDQCAGSIDAGLSVTGPAKRPNVELDLSIAGVEASEQRYGSLTATAHTRGADLVVAASLEGGDAGSLRLDAELPLEVGGRAPTLSTRRDATADVRVTDLQIDVLRAFAGTAIQRLDGRASAEVSLRGPLDDPRLSGALEVDDLVFGASATGMIHRDGRVRLAIDPTRFSLDELTLDGGKITAGGQIELARGLPRGFDLWLALDQAQVLRRSEAEATASGRVTLTGPVHAAELDGEVGIDRATLRPTMAPGGGAPEPDASIVVVHREDAGPVWVSGVPPELGGEVEPGLEHPVGTKRPARSGPSRFYDDLSMMITVRLAGPVVVQRYDANLRLGGEVYLTKAPADELRITGEIGGRRGWYIFQGRRFEIESAYVTFSGETPLDPYLDVDAQYRTPDYIVRIRITGTAKHPNLDLSSDPPLDQSDILAVILFGKPASQLDDSQGQVLQSQAFALLASYVAPELQRSILDTFGLTSLTFSMPTGNTAGTIGVGRYFGEDLFISVARDFGGPSGGTIRQLQGLVGSSVTIQYSLTPSVTLQGASSTEGESSVDAIWHRRY